MRHCLPLVLILALAGCPSPQVPVFKEQIAVEVDGPFVHAGSGMSLPAAFAGAPRTQSMRYGSTGNDISAGYNLAAPDGMIAATVFIYPALPEVVTALPPGMAPTTSCDRAYELARAEALDGKDGAQIVDERILLLPARGWSGRWLTFEHQATLNGVRRPVRSELQLMCMPDSPWLIKYRFTYLPGVNPRQQISAFMLAVPASARPRG